MLVEFHDFFQEVPKPVEICRKLAKSCDNMKRLETFTEEGVQLFTC